MSDIEDEFNDTNAEQVDTDLRCSEPQCTGKMIDGQCDECDAGIEVSALGSAFVISGEDGGPDVDLDHRRLCPDGGCIGVLGPDGSCKECGHVGDDVTSDPRLRGLTLSQYDDDSDEDDEDDECDQDDDDDEWDEDDDESHEDDDSDGNGDDSRDDLPSTFADRRLCPDGACIGVVGTDGSCPECGSVA
ncbi:MAG: hypothetical protein JKY56_02760 [Kofleriaceae bacterium]|nr:hypothetical protein [Kofleriaceae bacterium]